MVVLSEYIISISCIKRHTKLTERTLATLSELSDKLSCKAKHGNATHKHLILLREAKRIADAQKLSWVADYVDVWILYSACKWHNFELH